MSDPNSIVIETKKLSKRFKDVQAVDTLDMKVRKGEIFGFLGPNGAGKTTTIKMIMGLTHPSEGEVLINGQKAGPNTVEIRKDIGFLPERISFYDNLTPIQTLEFFCELKGVDKSIVKPLISDVGLEEAVDRKVGTFSKGMVQLLGVAQAMIGEPSIYILDEPMGGLDARWVKMVRDKIIGLNEKGATVIFSSHILSEVQNLCHRVAIINKGQLIAMDTIENLSEFLQIKPRLEIVIPSLEGKIPEGIEAIEGVEAVDAKDDMLYVTSDTGARAKVLALIENKGLTVSNFRTVEPSLEEAFVKLVNQDDKEGS
ncbi:MAG: ABC transporter ATP-binding protein [Thermoplasmata archaeon]|nr:MAG: ABC transporter ATP-binding protein [Thermoplasmata archaeon]